MPTSFQQPVAHEDGNLLLLTTTGARTGRPRTTPLGYVRHGGALLVVASNLGSPRHPGWYHNLLAHPVVGVEIGSRSFEALAVPAEGPRREELFAHVVRAEPGYGDYQARTARALPVVVLERAEPDGWEGPGEVRTLADKLLEVHTWLRGQLRQVRTEAEAHFASPGPVGTPPGLGLQIRQRCLAFCQALEFHHVSEDGHLFPGIARHHPHLADVFDRLADEHRTVARIQGGLADLLADIAVADPLRFRAELAEMSAQLNAHLDYEEEVLLPLLADVPWPPVGPSATP
ncbi:nitroreductase/quinone reductase family protein [Streptomyces sp. NPDC058534]|uniref:nitroreductase/quinone reductase family protein n=1 Tax=Streptomyces sp. NPDC058534 TaxID=3346541 RepID=UPI00365005F3